MVARITLELDDRTGPQLKLLGDRFAGAQQSASGLARAAAEVQRELDSRQARAYAAEVKRIADELDGTAAAQRKLQDATRKTREEQERLARQARAAAQEEQRLAQQRQKSLDEQNRKLFIRLSQKSGDGMHEALTHAEQSRRGAMIRNVVEGRKKQALQADIGKYADLADPKSRRGPRSNRFSSIAEKLNMTGLTTGHEMQLATAARLLDSLPPKLVAVGAKFSVVATAAATAVQFIREMGNQGSAVGKTLSGVFDSIGTKVKKLGTDLLALPSNVWTAMADRAGDAADAVAKYSGLIAETGKKQKELDDQVRESTARIKEQESYLRKQAEIQKTYNDAVKPWKSDAAAEKAGKEGHRELADIADDRKQRTALKEIGDISSPEQLAKKRAELQQAFVDKKSSNSRKAQEYEARDNKLQSQIELSQGEVRRLQDANRESNMSRGLWAIEKQITEEKQKQAKIAEALQTEENFQKRRELNIELTESRTKVDELERKTKDPKSGFFNDEHDPRIQAELKKQAELEEQRQEIQREANADLKAEEQAKEQLVAVEERLLEISEERTKEQKARNNEQRRELDALSRPARSEAQFFGQPIARKALAERHQAENETIAKANAAGGEDERQQILDDFQAKRQVQDEENRHAFENLKAKNDREVSAHKEEIARERERMNELREHHLLTADEENQALERIRRHQLEIRKLQRATADAELGQIRSVEEARAAMRNHELEMLQEVHDEQERVNQQKQEAQNKEQQRAVEQRSKMRQGISQAAREQMTSGRGPLALAFGQPLDRLRQTSASLHRHRIADQATADRQQRQAFVQRRLNADPASQKFREALTAAEDDIKAIRKSMQGLSKGSERFQKAQDDLAAAMKRRETLLDKRPKLSNDDQLDYRNLVRGQKRRMKDLKDAAQANRKKLQPLTPLQAVKRLSLQRSKGERDQITARHQSELRGLAGSDRKAARARQRRELAGFDAKQFRETAKGVKSGELSGEFNQQFTDRTKESQTEVSKQMLDDLQKRGKLDADTVGVLQEILKGIGEDLQNQAKLQEALGGVQQQLQALDGQRRQMQRASYA